MKICFYHDDLDGYCSAAIVYKYYDCFIELHKINYSDIDFLSDIKGYDEVIFVDFTPSSHFIEVLSENNKSILILDHHKTASDRLSLVQSIPNLTFKLDTTHSGCMVTWNHYYSNIQSPRVVELCEDYDIWKWEYSETEDFVNGMDLEPWKVIPQSSQWVYLLNGTGDLDRLIDFGHTITDYKRVYNSQLCEALSYEVDFQGHKVLVINAPKNSSKVFGKRIDDYEFVAIYSHKSDSYIVSLFSSTGFDTTTISTQFVDKKGNRGGGHPGASGFICSELPWKPLSDTI